MNAGPTPSVLMIGPANAGKSTLFNRLTGAGATTSNHAGTTVSVERAPARFGATDAVVVDLPGATSLAAASPDEAVTLDALARHARSGVPGVVVVVVDTPRLARSLYLAVQVLELGLPTVIAANLVDEARAAGREPQIDALSEALGVPVVATSARTGEGLDALRDAVAAALNGRGVQGRDLVDWPDAVRDAVAAVAAVAADIDDPDPVRRQAVARWAIVSSAEGAAEALAVPWPAVRAAREASGVDVAAAIVTARYAWIDARLPGLTAPGGGEDRVRARTEALDRVLLHPVAGTLVFFGVMWGMFWGLFAGADPMIAAVETLVAWTGSAASAGFDALGGPPWVGIVRDLVVDGIIAGVGAVIVFVPQIALLFLWLSVLEGVGYLARAAALVDRLLRAAGLPGKAFVPLLSGFACAVPAILATRTMPRFRDRLLTMLVLPLTTCSARLPVYALLTGALFPATWPGWPLPVRPTVMLAMYLLGTAVTLLAAVILSRTVLPGGPAATVLELPPYRAPDLRAVGRSVVRRTGEFLREAGRVILGATVVLWALLSFPRIDPGQVTLPPALDGASAEAVDGYVASVQLERSLGGRIGKAMEPLTRPVGFDWKIDVALLGAFAAREVFVGTLGVMYGIEGADEETVSLRDAMRADRRADGSPVFTPRVGASILVFFAFAMQCLSTLAVLRKESGGWRWPAFVVAYMSVLAYASSFVVYQGLGLLGWT